MKEAYCSYETAKLLKEKRFSGDMNHYISHHNSDGTSEAIATCTHQLACTWLREEHNIFITIYCGRNGFCDEPYFRATWQRLDDEPMEYPIGDCDYTYYETCVEAAIRYTLENLI